MAIKFVSPLGEVNRRDYPLASGTTASFFTANPNASTGSSDPIIIDAGYFGVLSSGALKVAGGTGNAGGDFNNATTASIPIPMLIITQKGDYTAQAIDKVTCITHGGIDIKTDIFDSSGLVEGALCMVSSGKLKAISSTSDVWAVATCIATADSAGFAEFRLFANPIPHNE